MADSDLLFELRQPRQLVETLQGLPHVVAALT